MFNTSLLFRFWIGVGGDRLYAFFFFTRLGAILDQNECKKTPVYCANPRKKTNMDEKKKIWRAQGGHFSSKCPLPPTLPLNIW